MLVRRKKWRRPFSPEFLQMATDEHQPPMIGGRRIKLKYAHRGGYNPPIIVVW